MTEQTHFFGDTPVSAPEKTERVEGVFESVARRYDIMNDVMSLGVHRIWKRRFLAELRPRRDDKLLDVAGGTGDIALGYKRRYGRGRDVTVCDLTQGMLDVGKARALDRGILDIDWVQGDAAQLPFADRSFDLYTISFGLRNVTHRDEALAEAYRVLKSGGRFFCLEFSNVEALGFRKVYDLYSRFLIPKMGEVIAKDRASYDYLVQSIRRFPPRRRLCKMLEAAGFTNVSSTPMSGGIVAIHRGVKV